MLINYIKIACRNLFRQKGYSAINILGLTLGLATALFIFLWVYDEVSFDRFHSNLDQIYRVEQDQVYNNQIFHVTVTPYPSGEGWKQEIPEIEDAVRIAYCGTLLCQVDEKRFYENGLIAADSTLFKTFSFKLLQGNPNLALIEPNSIVISAEIAQKYFGDDDPMGKTIVVDNRENFMVAGIMEDIPEISSLQFNMIIPFDFTKTVGMYNESWSSNSIQTFVRLNAMADPQPVDAKLTQTVIDHLDFSTRGDSPDEYRTKFMLAPLKRLHLHSYFGFNHTEVAFRSVVVMSLIGIFILIIAAINYMNLATARSAKRAREIGLRKVGGAARGQIVRQFFAESIITSLIAMVLACILVALLLDPFRTISTKDIFFDTLLTAPFVLGLVGMTLFTGLIAGIYPALFLSGFKPTKVLYGSALDRGGRGVLRRILVVVQFSLSLLLVIGTTIVYLQNNHVNNLDKGFTSSDVCYVRLQGDMNSSYYRIRESLSTLPEVEYVSGSTHRPGMIGSNSGGINWDGRPEDVTPLVSQDVVDFDFVELMNVPVVAGRAFSRDYPSDLATDSTGAFMINETMARIIGQEDVVGMNLSFMGIDQPIVGVLKDFHFTSARAEIPPLAIIIGPSTFLQFLSIKIMPGDRESIMAKIEQQWNEVMPDYPMEYRFLDDDYERAHRSRMRIGQLLLVFTIVALVIASLGLLGLSAFLAERKTREIGIRKTLGSTNVEIVNLLIKQFIWLILASIVIAIPIAFYVMSGFLNDYAYRLEMRWFLFAIPAALLLILAIGTVCIQAIRASHTHPAVCLRYE